MLLDQLVDPVFGFEGVCGHWLSSNRTLANWLSGVQDFPGSTVVSSRFARSAEIIVSDPLPSFSGIVAGRHRADLDEED